MRSIIPHIIKKNGKIEVPNFTINSFKRIDNISYDVQGSGRGTLYIKNIDTNTVTQQSVNLPYTLNHNAGERFEVSVDKQNWIFDNEIRYIRDHLNGSNKNNDNHWVEIQAYNKFGKNVAINKTVSSSSTPKVGGSNLPLVSLVDADISSNKYINITSSPATVSIDLESLLKVNSIKVWHYYADDRIYHNTKTEVSKDGTNWITIFDSSISGEYIETSIGHEIILKI